MKISCDTVSIETKLIGLKTNNNFNSVNFLFIIFKIALQNANVEIVDVEIICFEMKWQRVCVIITHTLCHCEDIICYFRQFLQWNAFRGIFCIELNIQVSRITVIIDWFNCLVINENFSSSINACNVASMLNNPLCSRAWKPYKCKIRLWEEKNANLKIRLIREYFFFSLTKNTIFFFFFH